MRINRDPNSTGNGRQRCLWRLVALGLLLVASALPGGCRTAPEEKTGADEISLQRYQFQAAAMGTLFRVVMYGPDQAAAASAADAAFHRISELEDIMSDYQADSELNLLCQKPVGEPVTVSEDLFDVLEKAQEISRISAGAFDVTVGPYVRLWRFARKRKVLPTEEEVASARAAVGWRNLRLDPRRRTVSLLVPNMRLDLGGIAKGYAADTALQILRERGFNRALVAASGDIAAWDPPPGHAGWRVGVSGMETTNSEPMLLLRRSAVSTSGDTEQFIEIHGRRYSHIVNPRTGLGLTNRIQASVTAPNATTTDAMATTVCILGPKRASKVLKAIPGTAAIIVVKEGDHLKTYRAGKLRLAAAEVKERAGASLAKRKL